MKFSVLEIQLHLKYNSIIQLVYLIPLCKMFNGVLFPFITCSFAIFIHQYLYRGADKSLARSTSRCILLDGENISFDAGLVIYINSTNIPPIMIKNRIYEHQNFLSL